MSSAEHGWRVRTLRSIPPAVMEATMTGQRMSREPRSCTLPVLRRGACDDQDEDLRDHPGPVEQFPKSRYVHDAIFPSSYRMFTARAARSEIVASEMSAWSIISSLAQRDSTGTSVGENAVLVLKARKR